MERVNEYKRTWNYIRANLIIMWKYITEYKINLYNILLTFVSVLVIQTYISYILANNFSSVILWTFEDFLLLNIIYGILWGIVGFFLWTNSLNQNIIRGNLNIMLMRPMNMFFKYYFYSFAGGGFVYLLLSIVYGMVIFFIFDIQVMNIVLSMFIFLLILTCFLVFWFAIDSFNLLILGFGDQIIRPFRAVSDMLNSYPAQFFIESKIKYLLNIVPMYFISSILVPILTNRPVDNFNIQISLLIVLILVSIVILVFNWNYGLKRYEAFG